MRTAYLDSGDPEMYFDNPNLRWGNPAYLLEPGDLGYVPVLPVNPSTKKKEKKMKKAHQRWFPSKINDQIAWFVNFRDKLPDYATTLGLAPATVAAILADCNWLIYVLQNWLNDVRTFGTTATQAALLAQSGPAAGPVVLPVFSAPALPTAVTPQPAGALDRIFALVQVIKKSGQTNPEIDDALRIVGSEATGPDLTSITPKFTVEIVGGQVIIKWGWDGQAAYLDSIQLEVDRNDGKGFGLLTIDTTPGYTDTQPFPAVKTVWTYRGIYRVDDHPVGVWSVPVSIPVGA